MALCWYQMHQTAQPNRLFTELGKFNSFIVVISYKRFRVVKYKKNKRISNKANMARISENDIVFFRQNRMQTYLYILKIQTYQII